MRGQHVWRRCSKFWRKATRPRASTDILSVNVQRFSRDLTGRCLSSESKGDGMEPGGDHMEHATKVDERIPVVAQALGYGGLIPFAAGAVVAATSAADNSLALHISQLYGASILSFLGAVHWGVALSENAASKQVTVKTLSEGASAKLAHDLIYGVVPSLVGWGASMLDPPRGIALLLPAFVGAFGYDYRRFHGDGAKSVPAWYLHLRKRLTVGACLGLGFSLGVSYPKLYGYGPPDEYPQQVGQSIEDLIVNVQHRIR